MGLPVLSDGERLLLRQVQAEVDRVGLQAFARLLGVHQSFVGNVLRQSRRPSRLMRAYFEREALRRGMEAG